MTIALLHADPIAASLILLAFVWMAAKLGGELAIRLKLPAVVGELLVGLILGALQRNVASFPDLGGNPELGYLAGLGVITLMFAVGLESTVPQMMRVGLASLRVAIIGVVAPTLLGLGGAAFLVPQGTPFPVVLFLAACLCATSIGISAQVLRERQLMGSSEGRGIVGAAVLDDVLGLLVLVVVSGLASAHGTTNGLPWAPLTKTILLALGFLGAALTVGRFTTPHLFRLANRFRSEQLLLPLGLAFAFLLAWLGSLAGLAPIVGAYAAGLILEPAHFEDLERREHHSLESLIHPLVTVLAPLFFVVTGARIDVTALLQPKALILALVLAVLGTVGKLLAGLGAGKGQHWLWIGWGMVPRGEVGLIFIATGAHLTLSGKPLLSAELQASLVAAILLTTVAGPIGLGWVLSRRRAARKPEH
ncbi:MAG: cation:proton antiporter [Acidobacteria bacterium]|nr:cation:proton antiporter [Acidobacteriota bacterium]